MILEWRCKILRLLRSFFFATHSLKKSCSLLHIRLLAGLFLCWVGFLEVAKPVMRIGRGPISSSTVHALQGVVPSQPWQPLASGVLFGAGLSQSQQGPESAAVVG
jgi:hypothetical protein